MTPDVVAPTVVAQSGVLEHRRSWSAYFKGIDADWTFDPTTPNSPPKCQWDDRTDKHSHNNDPRLGDAKRGFWKWVRGFFYRAYAQDDDGTPYAEDVYACPWFPEKLAAHEAAHTLVFGNTFPEHPGTDPATGNPFPLATQGLDHEPLGSFDLMLPGYISPFRFKDSRGIEDRYHEWVEARRIAVLREER